MKLEHGKNYLTKDGYIVEIVIDRDGYFASQRTSPGTLHGSNVVDYGVKARMDWAKKHGWLYSFDGKIEHSSHSLISELEIVAEYPYKLTDPPEGYKWKGGFPRLQMPTADGCFLSVHGQVLTGISVSSWGKNPVIGQRRIALEKVATTSPETIVAASPQQEEVVATPLETWPKFYVQSNGSKFSHEAVVIRRDEKTRAVLVKFGGQMPSSIFWDSSQDYFVSSGTWVEISKDDAHARINGLSEAKPQWPKYYINKNVLKNWGVVRYENGNCDFINAQYGDNKHSPFGWGHDSEVKRGVWKEVTKEEMVAIFDKDPFSEAEKKVVASPPQEQYYIVPATIPWFDKSVKYVIQKNNEWIIYTDRHHKEQNDGSGSEWWQKKIQEGRLIPCSKEEALAKIGEVPPNVTTASTLTVTGSPVVATNCVITTPVLKEEKMKSSTVVNAITSTGSAVAKTVNYLYVEPTKIIGGYVKRSLRYIVLASTVSAIVYGVNDPAALKKRVASFVPKITIEAPSAMK